MPWKSLNTWLFDGNRKSLVPEILLKSSSPVSQISLLTMFMNNGPLNHYLNKYMNTVWIFSIDKEEVLKFIKKCILEYKVRKGSTFYSYRPTKNKLYEILREKIVILKNDDLSLLADIISKSKDRDKIYETLGIEVNKIKKGKKTKPKKITQKLYITENFSLLDVK